MLVRAVTQQTHRPYKRDENTLTEHATRPRKGGFEPLTPKHRTKIAYWYKALKHSNFWTPKHHLNLRFLSPYVTHPPPPHTPSINSLRSQGETSPSLPAGFRNKP